MHLKTNPVNDDLRQRRRAAAALLVSATCMLCGCPPLFPGASAMDPAVDDLEVGGAGATAPAFPPPPSLNTLCSVRFAVDTLQDVRARIGEPQSEETEQSNAALSYHFSNDVTLHFGFEWSDGSFGVDELSRRGSLSGRRGYILVNAAIMGQPYPDCWPRTEPK